MLIKTKSFTLSTYSKGDPNSKKLALVLPGKLDSKDYAHMISHVDFLAKLGYFALSFDPPGTWESPGNISLYTTTNYLKAVDELIERFDNKPTFIMGHSRGASVSMIASSKNPHIVSYAAVMPAISETSITSRFKNVSMRDLPPGGGEEVKKFELPDSFHEDEMKYKLTPDILKSEKPKLIIAGTHDQLAPAEQVRRVFYNLSELKELYELDSDHDYRLNPKLIEEVNKAVGGFLRKFH